MVANLTAALKDIPSEIERIRIEKDSEARHGAATNYFQERTNELVQPASVNVKRDGERAIVEWTTALAGREPIRSYEVRAGNRALLSLPFRPQMYEAPLSVSLPASAIGSDTVTAVAFDGAAADCWVTSDASVVVLPARACLSAQLSQWAQPDVPKTHGTVVAGEPEGAGGLPGGVVAGKQPVRRGAIDLLVVVNQDAVVEHGHPGAFSELAARVHGSDEDNVEALPLAGFAAGVHHWRRLTNRWRRPGRRDRSWSGTTRRSGSRRRPSA